MSRAIGLIAEDLASSFLSSKDLEIVRRNFYSKFGEIDIIAESKTTLHFVEVKYTSLNTDPIVRITKEKLIKILKTIDFYNLKHSIKKQYQVDIVLICNEKIEWIQNVTI